MKLTIFEQLKDKFVSLEIDETEPVSTLQELISIEFGMEVSRQNLSFGTKILQPNQLIKDCGLKNDDMVILTPKMNNLFGQQPMQQQQGGNANNNNLLQSLQNVMNGFGGNNNGNNFQQQFQSAFNPMNNPQLIEAARRQKEEINSNPDTLNFLFHQDRELAEAAVSDNIQDMVKVLHERMQKQNKAKMEREQRLLKLQADPMNPDNQREIEKIIQEKNVEEQRELAMEEHPEFFGRISMLYIEIAINGNPIQAFVDSGAESTIMSRQCAERCGLMRLLDTRFHGTALGVGSAKILGRIHVAQMEILDKKLPVNLTILDDDKIEFLLGLDTLKRYQSIMNLGERNLTFVLDGKHLTVPFLHDGQIKKQISISQEQALHKESENNKMQEEKNLNNNNNQNGAGFKEDDIKTLTELGASRQEAIAALTQCQGNVEFAANLISANKYGM